MIALFIATPLALWGILIAYGRYRESRLWLSTIETSKAAEKTWNTAHPEAAAAVVEAKK